MALVCYHRARRLRPGASEYDRGIKKAEGAIEISIGGQQLLYLTVHSQQYYNLFNLILVTF